MVNHGISNKPLVLGKTTYKKGFFAHAPSSIQFKLDGKVVKKFFGFKQQVEVIGWCSECFREIPNPMLGCPNCSRTSDHPSILDLEEGPG